MTTFGRFDDAAREYVITRPDTPLPWINYLGSEDYFGIISNTAGGYSFFRDALLRRLTRYRYNNVPTDVGGRYLYVRDAAAAILVANREAEGDFTPEEMALLREIDAEPFDVADPDAVRRFFRERG